MVVEAQINGGFEFKQALAWALNLAETAGVRLDGLPAGGDYDEGDDEDAPCRCDDCTLLRLAAGGTE